MKIVLEELAKGVKACEKLFIFSQSEVSSSESRSSESVTANVIEEYDSNAPNVLAVDAKGRKSGITSNSSIVVSE